ncbi:MAG: 1-(5-phosphoribosyl)-5-[(5-phosphoribosylamino)methylideneamino]imidazole-4-carboxamide isomerase [Candidatus Omnitrophota bacterium]
MKVIPAIDIMNGKTVRLEQGRYDRKLSYDIDPVDAARRWVSSGAELIHVVDLDGARDGRPVNPDIAGKIAAELGVPVETGGGFREKSDIREALGKGVWRVVIGSRALEDMRFAKECIEEFGEHVIFSLDSRDRKLQVHGWEKNSGLGLIDVLEGLISLGVKEVIFTDIRKDGMLSGPSTAEIERILSEVKVNIISAGGVKTVEHVKQLKALEPLGVSGVIIGRALYEGTIDLKEAIDAGKTDNPMS